MCGDSLIALLKQILCFSVPSLPAKVIYRYERLLTLFPRNAAQFFNRFLESREDIPLGRAKGQERGPNRLSDGLSFRRFDTANRTFLR